MKCKSASLCMTAVTFCDFWVIFFYCRLELSSKNQLLAFPSLQNAGVCSRSRRVRQLRYGRRVSSRRLIRYIFWRSRGPRALSILRYRFVEDCVMLLHLCSMGVSYSPHCDPRVQNWLPAARCTAPYPLIQKEIPGSVCASGF